MSNPRSRVLPLPTPFYLFYFFSMLSFASKILKLIALYSEIFCYFIYASVLFCFILFQSTEVEVVLFFSSFRHVIGRIEYLVMLDLEFVIKRTVIPKP
jgi:hypothetical protein